MDDKNMREISMDEMDRVSGGSGENPPGIIQVHVHTVATRI